MQSEFHLRIKKHLQHIFAPLFGADSVHEEVVLVRNLPRYNEEYYDLVKDVFRKWYPGGRYPENNKTSFRKIDFQIANSELLIEVDGDQHCSNGYRKDSFRFYPEEVTVYYDWMAVRGYCSSEKPVQRPNATSGWEKSRYFRHRDEERAFRDLVADVVAWHQGFKLIRVFP